MKSEKAEKYLSENGLGYPYTGYVTEQAAERAAELAEQEAEERMRQKAAKAYCHDCCCTVVGKCGIGSEKLYSITGLYQKTERGWERLTKWRMRTVGSMRNKRDMMQRMFGLPISGAEHVYEELTRWNDPDESRPNNMQRVLVKCQKADGSIEVDIATFHHFLNIGRGIILHRGFTA